VSENADLARKEAAALNGYKNHHTMGWEIHAAMGAIYGQLAIAEAIVDLAKAIRERPVR